MALKFLKQDTLKRRDLILNAPITSTIFLLSIPTLMMGAVQALIPLIDGLFINNMVGTLAAGAINYCGPIVNTMMALAQGLSVAGMAVIGQTYGKGDFDKAKKISTQLICFAFILGCIIAPILACVALPISKNVTPEISHDVFTYMSLFSLTIPFSFLESIYNSIKNASGKPEATFIRMLLMLVLKVIFNVLFIGVFKWKIVGAVMASLFANMLITIWMFYELFIQKTADRLTIKGFKFDKYVLKNLIQIGIPSMLSSLTLNLGFILINNEVQKYGAVALSGQGIAGNIGSLCFILPSSFGSAITTMVSMNVGANNSKRAKLACLRGCIISAITAAVLILIIVPLAPHLTVFFTRDTNVLNIANQSLSIFIYSVIGFGVCMVIQGAFVGLGKTKIPLILSILRIWLLRYLFIILTEKHLGVFSVFWGNVFSNYMAAFISIFIILKIKWVSSIKLKDSN